jgi:hypothetical protein
MSVSKCFQNACILALTVQLLGSAARAGDPQESCRELIGAAMEANLRYLQGDRSEMKPSCVVYAIDQAAAAHTVAAVPVLVKLLDYRLPDRPLKPEDAVQTTMPWLGTKYPAARGIFAAGKPAVQALVTAVAAPDTSAVARANAVEMVVLIYRDNVAEAPAVLNRAARASDDPEVSRRLLDAARDAASKCPEPQRGACLSNALK